MIILDLGSGETCGNDWPTAKRMIDELAAVDSRRHQVVLKWQLFEKVVLPPEVVHSGQSGGATELKALHREVFCTVYEYAWKEYCYMTTASVFDKGSLQFLLKFKVPFVKFATRPDLYWMIDLLPKKAVPWAVVSFPDVRPVPKGVIPLYSIREYPAQPIDYMHRFGRNLRLGISDHTDSFWLWTHYQPAFYETHYRLEDSGGLDNGVWAKTPNQLREVLG